MTNRFAVVLAAGQGTRMKSSLYKVLHPVCGKPMVQHVVDQLNQLHLSKLITVVGFGAEKVKEQLGEASEFVIQEEQLGTGHAVMMADSLLGKEQGTTIVVCGDTPLLTAETMEALISKHEQENAKVSVLTTEVLNPTGYGRVVRNKQNEVEKIVEHKDASEDELKISEINTGTYCFDNQSLFEALKNVSNDNAQGEYYLPDVIEIVKQQGEKIIAHKTDDINETMGVNDRVALSRAEKNMRKRINEKHMRNGVSLIDPDQTYIGPEVKIEQDVVIYPGSIIDGHTNIQTGTVIGPHSEIKNCEVGSDTIIKQSVAHDSHIGNHVKIGPFAHIRPDSNIHNEVKIGNFVEVKKAVFEEGSKASHLSYIGDAEVGKEVNIGCGTITVNYDGENKHKTVIEDGAFVGCNSNLIAPVRVKRGAYVAAGSTITEDVPEESLSIARSRQTNKEGYIAKRKNSKE
ncbi:bifunctional UDP-N-acetylglucosamine diphosphorylase/glucosamine-1-phosphate N-acetyltransferase GlmU [Salinibacillus xinjiangensis]|uniref:Bifunctional protein GlmU n=1 Tax=Salinibacillus xinjiangensis TaxID=1229268 RepID=A0A6G1XAY3_9BACI|nr:bifunctional UDP-N-acetylglucosamine diphosphorylase/glucosamine-1-phosphate N-acetyltransferase GlmU [Salinibacillus xinjiangensis]MRG88173.1 bifunctional UDP-N-acetylglucosamine diphosphorylase/glucosamine-1-phosphate N-acetyltransferase GlmU [Salinibacillus xinjiangensis]